MQLYIPKQVPFVPSSWNQVWTMVELSGIKPGQKMADLGSGDGRIVITFAKMGAEAHGYEIEPKLAVRTETKIFLERLDNKAFIHWGDYWKENLSFYDYDIVTIFGLTSVMERLEQKLELELKPGAKVISNIFTFPNWKSVKEKDNIYLYIVP